LEKAFDSVNHSLLIKRDAGTVWAWATAIQTCRKTSPSF
jgi:hypothetical protein